MAGKSTTPAKPKVFGRGRLKFAPPTSGDATVEMIQTEEADPALQQFPAVLRRQIEEYLKNKNVDEPLTFIGGSTIFRLFQTTIGEPAYFVESVTKEPLDAGLYRYGVRKSGRHIIVVQPRQDKTTFNKGKPAIIAYFSKGKKDECASRFAVWSPDGLFRNDLFVDRVRIQNSTSTVPPASSQSWSPTQPSIKAGSPLGLRPTGLVSDDEEELDFGLQPKSLQQQIGYRYGQAGKDGSPASTAMRSSPTYEADDDLTLPSGGSAKSTKRTRSALMDEDDHDVRKKSHLSTPIRNTTTMSPNLAPASTPLSGSTPNMRENTIIRFMASVGKKEVLLSKTLKQCDSVQKFFAYARMARISDTNLTMLAANLNDDHGTMVLIVRDDDSTFEDLMDVIAQEQVVNDKDIQIVVTPAAF